MVIDDERYIRKVIECYSSGEGKQVIYISWGIFREDRVVAIEFLEVDGTVVDTLGEVPQGEIVSSSWCGVMRWLQYTGRDEHRFYWHYPAPGMPPEYVQEYRGKRKIRWYHFSHPTYGKVISREQAKTIAEQWIGRTIPGDLISEKFPENVGGYGLSPVPFNCWYVHASARPHDEGVYLDGPSRLLCISKETGLVEWDNTLPSSA